MFSLLMFPPPPQLRVEVKAWHDLADAAALQLRKRDQIQVVGYLATYTTPAGYSRLQVGSGPLVLAQGQAVVMTVFTF